MPEYLIILFLLSNFRESSETVLRGSRARHGQFPWLIQFHTISPCGGVLISPDWVLTAAQCVQYKRNSIVLYATGLNGTDSSQSVSVKATYIHPNFHGYSRSRDYDNNIALLKLVKAFDMCDGKVRLLDIAPVRLDDDYKSCLIFGWQSTVAPSSKVHAKPIQYSKVLINSWRVCMYMHEGNASYRNVFCTMVEDDNGVRACAGNPGSPVVCEDQYQRMVLLGIASWSNFSLDCGGLPTYLGVSIFRSWMWDLIFGHKNLEQWEASAEVSTRVCEPERFLGNLQEVANPRSSWIRNYTEKINRKKFDSLEPEKLQEDAYDMVWKSSNRRNSFAREAKRIFGVTKVPELRTKLEPPKFNNDDYPRLLDDDIPRNVPNFDLVRDREERLSQYREIGSVDFQHRDFVESESLGTPPEHQKVTYFDDKLKKIDLQRDTADEKTEYIDELEFLMPDGIEDFRSSSSIGFFYNKNLKILSFLSTIVNVFNLYAF